MTNTERLQGGGWYTSKYCSGIWSMWP